MLLSIPVSGLLCPDGRSVAIRPFVAGLRQESGLTASLARIYSNVSETPVDRILTGAGGNASGAAAPLSFALEQNYPNPFNPSTTIRYAIPRKVRVVLAVYNMIGQEVATLVDREEAAGGHEVLFTPVNLASGVYFCRISAGGFIQTKRMSLIK